MTRTESKSNCYAYALNWPGKITYGWFLNQTWSYTFTLNPAVIGDSSVVFDPTGFTFSGQAATDMDVIEMDGAGTIYKSYINDYRTNGNWTAFAFLGAALDAISNNHVFREATAPEIAGNVPDGQWVVYLVATTVKTDDPQASYTNVSDYHWYRQNFDANGNFDGTWSHKPGQGDVTNRVVSTITVIYKNNSSELKDIQYSYGSVITNPATAARTVMNYVRDEQGNSLVKPAKIDYDIVVGAYLVGPKP